MERQFSIIIPTMYKCPGILIQLVHSLVEDPAVAEIIIIENTKKGYRPSILNVLSDKIVILHQEKNMYVNPSWNIGVANSTKNYIGIINDDITIPEKIFSQLSTVAIEDMGVIGACDFLIQEVEYPKRFTTRYSIATATNDRTWGYGIIMVMHKNNYHIIPEELLIWAGDDYLFHQNIARGKQNLMLLAPIQTNMSATSGNSEFEDIKNKDVIIYESTYKI